MAALVATYIPSGDLPDDLSRVTAERLFSPGEYGEIVIQLDRSVADESERDNIFASAKSMSSFLRQEGLVSWPGKEPATIDWPTRTLHIYFIAQAEPGRYEELAHGSVPSALQLLLPIAVVAARAAPMAARASGIFRIVNFAVLVGFIAKLGKLPFLRLFFSTTGLVIGGTLLWAMIDPDSMVRVYKHIGGALGKGAGAVLEGIFKNPIMFGVAVMSVGLILVVKKK